MSQSTLKCIAQTCNTIRLNKCRIITCDTGIHPCSTLICIYNIQFGNLIHCCQCLCCSDSTIRFIRIRNCRTFKSCIIECILDKSTKIFIVLDECTLYNGNRIFSTNFKSGMFVNVFVHFIYESQEFFVSRSTINKYIFEKLLRSHTVKAFTKYGIHCFSIVYIKNSIYLIITIDGPFKYSICSIDRSSIMVIDRKSLPIREISLCFVHVNLAIRDVNNINFI